MSEKLDKDFEQLRKDFAALQNDVSALAQGLKQAGLDGKSELGAKAQAQVDQARDRVRALGDDIEGRVQDNPLGSLATAFGIGIVLGIIRDRR